MGNREDLSRAPVMKTRAAFGVDDVVPVFLETKGWQGKLKVSLKAPKGVKVRNFLPAGVLHVKPDAAKTLCWAISTAHPMDFELVAKVVHSRWTWEVKKKIIVYKLHQLGVDPTVAFCVIRYHDDEEGYLAQENRQEVCSYGNEYPLERVFEDFKGSAINTVIMTASSGSMLRENHIDTEWFAKYVRGCHAQGMRVGICLPFADTYENDVTCSDPDVQQRTHKGDLCSIEGRVAVVEMDAPAFVEYAKALIEKASPSLLVTTHHIS